MAKPRKRIYLINRDFQLRYTYAAAFVGVGSTLLTAVGILYPLYVFEILRIPQFLPLPILLAMGTAALLNIALVALFGIFITHRIAGPMYSLVRSFRRVEIGHWAGHLRLREGDDLKYVVRNFNQMVDGLLYTCRKDVSELESIAAKLNDSGDTKAASAAVDELRNRMAHRMKEVRLEGVVIANKRDR